MIDWVGRLGLVCRKQHDTHTLPMWSTNTQNPKFSLTNSRKLTILLPNNLGLACRKRHRSHTLPMWCANKQNPWFVFVGKFIKPLLAKTWHIYMYHMIHSYVWYDLCICVTWRMHTCDMMHLYVRRNALIFIRETWSMYMCDVNYLYVWHDAF